ncbi:GntR family transcriptional regulator [Mycobacterium sp. CBMA293]|uniref:GntR family transcriptional regulator n=1 Tax=unclassified Mycolicibacterium TaxID=2636767 RepID=UPI0012DDAD7D|nr:MULTISPECIES: GntR family transcriptional regulator [unclassified Mycolicibacterium]MUL45419.1 GntR family transcriptional regulator [Mycolicibacterium sp. CBMA 360]MUL56940.1 GntR family transcriptional regulator [Mycolicibacterium sp. CBMA 335]MUL69980.1 GntR family transcriptional regulator [Mycolicibacterium sp. CBMA 311]MUL92028.1 GntR family transcriptional regulator [Mycolicibacterium sp. CBMA 230]MUM05766.1 GntR family transcriptional regulator [Mycolicibacterium sp. CBMA 213]
MNTASEPEFAAPAQLSDDVARFVRRRIFNGTFPAGEYLRLDQVATELGVSVTPVREALLNLRAEGLLVQHPRRGFMVLEVTARDVSDVAMVQAFVGGELAARAAENITADQVTELTRIQDALEQAYQHTDVDRMVRLNHEFHRLINVIADSPKLTQFMSGITRYAPESVFPTLEGWPDLSIRDHRRVIAALKNGDASTARTAMAEHFEVGVEPLTKHLSERGVIREG